MISLIIFITESQQLLNIEVSIIPFQFEILYIFKQ